MNLLEPSVADEIAFNEEILNVISLGAGVQSSTMAFMAAYGLILPLPSCANFADTQAEPESVYKWLSYLCGVEIKYMKRPGGKVEQAYVESGVYQSGVLPYPVRIITNGSLTEDILTLRARMDGKGYYIHSGIPAYTTNADDQSHGIIPRQCTYNYKIEVLDKEVRRQIGVVRMREWRSKHRDALKEITINRRNLALWKRRKKEGVQVGAQPRRPIDAWAECGEDPLAVVWMGISLDEISRMKSPRVPWMNFRYPLVDLRMKRHDCLNWMEKQKLPRPPRSACVYCPYHSDNEWRRLRDEEPDAFAEAVRIDKEYRRLKAIAGLKSVPYLHASRVPLDEVDFRTDEDHGQQVLFNNDCAGMCGV